MADLWKLVPLDPTESMLDAALTTITTVAEPPPPATAEEAREQEWLWRRHEARMHYYGATLAAPEFNLSDAMVHDLVKETRVSGDKVRAIVNAFLRKVADG